MAPSSSWETAYSANRGAQAVVVFPLAEEDRAPVLRPENYPGIEDALPVISVSRETAQRILIASHPLSGSWLDEWQATGTPPPSQALITQLKCSFTGRFERFETRHFSIRYRKAAFAESELTEVAQLNERSVTFLLDLFQPEVLSWTRAPTTYFRGFDSKVFYTFHWGSGLATASGSFLVYEGTPDFGLIVHENAHTLLERNWGRTTSFLEEGAGRFAQARATDPLMNHRETQVFLAAGKGFPLEQMVTFSIGCREPPPLRQAPRQTGSRSMARPSSSWKRPGFRGWNNVWGSEPARVIDSPGREAALALSSLPSTRPSVVG